VDSEDSLGIKALSDGFLHGFETVLKNTLASEFVVSGFLRAIEAKGDFVDLVGFEDIDDLWVSSVGVDADEITKLFGQFYSGYKKGGEA